MPKASRVSVIIPVYGPTPHLHEILMAIEAGTRQPDEIIVSHSGIDDPAAQLRDQHPSVRVLHSDDRLFAGDARNRGAAAAESDVLAFCDSDVLPRYDWLERLIDALGTSGGRFVVGSVGTARSGGYWGMSNWLCEFSEQAPWRHSRRQSGGASCNMAVGKSDFEHVDGFPKGVRIGEDTILFSRLRQSGLDQCFVPDAEVGHFNNAGFRSFARHQFTMGRHFVSSRKTARRPGWQLGRWSSPVIWLPKCALVMGRLLGPRRKPPPNPLLYFPGVLAGTLIFAAGCLRGADSDRECR